MTEVLVIIDLFSVPVVWFIAARYFKKKGLGRFVRHFAGAFLGLAAGVVIFFFAAISATEEPTQETAQDSESAKNFQAAKASNVGKSESAKTEGLAPVQGLYMNLVATEKGRITGKSNIRDGVYLTLDLKCGTSYNASTGAKIKNGIFSVQFGNIPRPECKISIFSYFNPAWSEKHSPEALQWAGKSGANLPLGGIIVKNDGLFGPSKGILFESVAIFKSVKDSGIGEKERSMAANLSKLYVEFQKFKNTEDFKFYGFGQGGRYYSWMKSIDKIRAQSRIFECGVVAGDLLMVATQYFRKKPSEHFLTVVEPSLSEGIEQCMKLASKA